MRTALILLFLLALGAVPGAMLPQWPLNQPKTQQYITSHGWWGTLLNKLQFFSVFSSVWFSAVYVLLFVSLVGCLLPRTLDYGKQLFAKPVLTPRNLARLPHHSKSTVDGDPADVLAAARHELRGWRLVERAEADGSRSISAERGYLRETGNLVFHFALLGLIVAFALGKMFSYTGQVIVLANGSQFCDSGVLNYDSFTPGLEVDGTQLDPWCVRVNGFTASYQPTGQPAAYSANIDYQSGDDLSSDTWRPYDLKVNSPLRTAGDRVYLIGHGYAPQFTVTYPNGQTRTGLTQWKPDDQTTDLSEGATKFADPPGVTNPAELKQQQLAVTGLFAPTALFDGDVITSTYPALDNPAASIFVYQGDLGSDAGSQSIFAIDQGMVDSGQLKKVGQANLTPGQSVTLSDGTKVRFDLVQPWVSLQVSHDPTQDYVLLFAILLLLGLITSLVIKRRRLWVRAGPSDDGPPRAGGGSGRTVVEIGGLARTDQAGYGEEFVTLSARLLAAARTAARSSAGKDTT
ncbi:MAG TPA: cytochrome c biogenesis protein ResB [Pseudonocardiaceae bacterium]|nr:cytochrome c biogenesis protein ResB [Pseudonocardiaceae bacterium]